MNNFAIKISKYLALAVDVAPHLQSILQLIVGQNNAPSISERQWVILSAELEGFRKKMTKLGFNFHDTIPLESISRERFVSVITLLMNSVLDFSLVMRNQVFVPSLDCSFIGQEYEPSEKIKKLLEIATHELSPSTITNRPPGDMYFDKLGLTLGVKHLLGDAILALVRTRPNRVLCSGGSLFVRDIMPFSKIMAKSHWDKIEMHMDHYVTEIINLTDDVLNVSFRPKHYFFEKTACLNIYNKDVSTFRIFDILTSGKLNSSFLKVLAEGDPQSAAAIIDVNFGPVGLYNRIIGTAITSLDFAFDLLCLIGGESYMRNKLGDIASFRQRFSEYNIGDIMFLISPIDLHGLIHENKVPVATLCNVHEYLVKEITMIKMGIFKMGLYHEYVQTLLSGKVMNKNEVVFEELYPRIAPSAPSRDASFDMSIF